VEKAHFRAKDPFRALSVLLRLGGRPVSGRVWECKYNQSPSILTQRIKSSLPSSLHPRSEQRPDSNGNAVFRDAELNPWSLAAAGTLAVFVLLLWFDAARLGHVHTGDTDNLVVGTRRAIECIHAGTWKACGLHPGTRFSDVFPYPPLQYLPAAALVLFGLSDGAVVEALGRLNILAFAATLVVCAWAFPGPRNSTSRTLAIIAVLASSAVYQSTAGFGEMLAAAMAAAAVAAVLRRNASLIAVTVACASLGKDTLLPFLMAVGFLCGRDEGDFLPSRRVWLPLVIGGCLGALAIAAFNEFRFGSPVNVFYLDPLFRTPGLQLKITFLLGEWFSPSAGLTWYWPVATGILFICGAVGIFQFVRRERTCDWLPLLTLMALAVLFTAGLASWYSPFGWIAYGPRLSVPMMPTFAIAGVHLLGARLEIAAREAFRTTAGFVLTSALLICAGWPQFGSAWSHGAAFEDLMAGDSTCPRMTEYTIQADLAQYYRCTEHDMWRLHSLPIDEAATEGGMAAVIARITAGCCVIVLLASVRRGISNRRHGPANYSDSRSRASPGT